MGVLMRCALASVVACFSPDGLAAAEEARCATRQPINIPAAPLGSALQAVARECGYQIAYISGDVAPFHSNGVSGELTLDEALTRLLSDTGLTYSYSGRNGLVIKLNVPPETSGTKTVATGNDGAHTGSTVVESPQRSQQAQAGWQRQESSIPVAGGSTRQGESAAPVPLREIVVTGSRVIENGNDSPAPVTVVDIEEMSAVHPGTVADQLNDLPQFSGSSGQYSNNSAGSANNGNPNPQANVLNLRNFGATRTLILIDGHRAAPTSPNGTVDIDMIPQLLLQRVDVVTGGVSAVYGADAITGVVNFITDKHFNGVKIHGQAGQSTYSDDPTHALGIAWGSDLSGGRGHLEASYEYRADAGVPYRSSRPFLANRPTVYLVNGQYILTYNAAHNDKSFGGLISGNNALAGQTFTADGVLTPFVHGTPLGTNAFEVGGDGSYFDTSLKAQLKMHQVFGRFDYDFSEEVHGYVRVSGAHNYNSAYNLTQPFFNSGTGTNTMLMSATNPFLQPQYRAALGTATTFSFAKTMQDAPRQNAETFAHQYSVDTGLSVQFGKGYEWDIAYIRSANTQKVRQNNALNGRKLAASLDAVINPANNQVVCNVTLTNPDLYPGCIPDNPFGPTSDNQHAISYFMLPVEVVAHTDMDDVDTSVTGTPFSTWAGPVNMALSAEWRQLTYHLDSTTNPNNASNPLDCTGLRFLSCTATSQEWLQAASAPVSRVSVNVSEAALEFDVPLLKNVPFARDVSLNAAARHTSYSTSGIVSTWKVGMDWKFSNSLAFRGTRSRDIRAPTLFELYQPATIGNYNLTDFVTNVQMNGVTVAPDGKVYQPATTYTQGNPLLLPEMGNTTTAGFVYRPGWAPNLSMSLDSFFINLSDAITTQNGTNQTVQLGCAASGGVSPVCQLIVRPIDCCSTVPANTATAFYSSGVNIATQWTQGADLEVNYAGLLRDRAYSLRLLTTYQPHIVYVTPGSGSFDMGGAAFGNQGLQAAPVWRASLLARYTPVENLVISALVRWRSSLAWGPEQSAPLAPLVFAMQDIPSVAYTNLNLSYLFKHVGGARTEVYFNAQNLLDRKPPVAAAFNNVQPGLFLGNVLGDDPIGRYYTLGFRHRM